MKEIEKIKSDIRPVLESFLNQESLFPKFKEMAKAVGYEGDDPTLIKSALFTANNGQIGFVIAELNDMFFEFQLFEQIKDKEPFKTILEEKPESKTKIIALAKRIVNGEEVTNKDIEAL